MNDVLFLYAILKLLFLNLTLTFAEAYSYPTSDHYPCSNYYSPLPLLGLSKNTQINSKTATSYKITSTSMSVHYEEDKVSYVTPLQNEEKDVGPMGTEINSVKQVQDPCKGNNYVEKDGFLLFEDNTFSPTESGADTTTSVPPSSSSSTSATTSASTSLPDPVKFVSQNQAGKMDEISIFHQLENIKLHYKFHFPFQSPSNSKKCNNDNESSSTEWLIQYSDNSYSENENNGSALGIVNSTLEFLLKTVCNMCYEIQIERIVQLQNSEILELR